MTEAKTQQQLPDETTSEEIKYKGVRKRKWGKWVSEIRLPNSRDRIWLGSHDKPEKAARAFDAAQFCLRGPHANFNFPDSLPEIAGGHRFNAQEIRAAAAEFASSGDGGGTPKSDREHSEVTAHAVGGGGAIDWPVLDLSDTFDIGSDFDDYFGFENIIMGRNEQIYNSHVLFPMGDIEEELVHGGGDFSHQSNFLWNFDNY